MCPHVLISRRECPNLDSARLPLRRGVASSRRRLRPATSPLRVSFAKARPARTWPLGQSGSSSSAFTPVPNSGCPSYRSVGNIKANDTMKQRRDRAQRGVERAFRAAPDHQFTTAELVGSCYGRRPLALPPPTCVSASLLGGLLCRCATSAAAATQSALADRVAKR